MNGGHRSLYFRVNPVLFSSVVKNYCSAALELPTRHREVNSDNLPDSSCANRASRVGITDLYVINKCKQ